MNKKINTYKEINLPESEKRTSVMLDLQQTTQQLECTQNAQLPLIEQKAERYLPVRKYHKTGIEKATTTIN